MVKKDNPTLAEAIQGLDQEYVNGIMASNDTAALNSQYKQAKCPKKRQLLRARLVNLNYLCAQWD